jgi:hypothetical protein
MIHRCSSITAKNAGPPASDECYGRPWSHTWSQGVIYGTKIAHTLPNIYNFSRRRISWAPDFFFTSFNARSTVLEQMMEDDSKNPIHMYPAMRAFSPTDGPLYTAVSWRKKK